MITQISSLIKRLVARISQKSLTPVPPEDGTPQNREPELTQLSQKHPGPSKKPPPPIGIRPAPPEKKRERWQLGAFEVPPLEGKTRFHDLNLPLSLMHAIADLSFDYCMPVQAETLPFTLKGQDVTARAQTGTGKSAAFLVTIIARLLSKPLLGTRTKGVPRALILAPTRELVLQIDKDARDLAKYTPLKIVPVFGGMDYAKQQNQLRDQFTDIIAATPGRLIDFMNQRIVSLKNVEILVIDEADRMLDMGFMPDIRKIVYATPHKDERQTLFFSATLSPEVLRMANQWTKNALGVEIDPDNLAAENINQKVYIVTEDEKVTLLVNLVQGENLERVLLFVNRRDTARNLTVTLGRYGLRSEILSGEVAQKQRIKTLDDFRSGKVRLLVATDVAARGLHIEGISHVINYDMPQDPEHYIHRIGRTGRAGALGISISFADEMSSFYIPEIEAVLGNRLECEYPDEELLKPLPEPMKASGTQTAGSRPFRAGKNRKPQGSGGPRRRRPPRQGEKPKTQAS
ncbi:MAG: DEAD/DEAH box helicase [Pseudomonadota bacterium]